MTTDEVPSPQDGVPRVVWLECAAGAGIAVLAVVSGAVFSGGLRGVLLVSGLAWFAFCFGVATQAADWDRKTPEGKRRILLAAYLCSMFLMSLGPTPNDGLPPVDSRPNGGGADEDDQGG